MSHKNQPTTAQLRDRIEALLSEDEPTYPAGCPVELAVRIDAHFWESREVLKELIDDLDDLEDAAEPQICSNCGGDLEVGRHWIQTDVDYWICRQEPRYYRD